MKLSYVGKLKVNIELEIPTAVTASEEASDALKAVLNKFNAEVMGAIEDTGLHGLALNPRHISQINGGYSLYNTFALKEPVVNLKLLTDIRISNHSAKPGIATKHKQRSENLLSMFSNDIDDKANLLVLDGYCEQHDVGVNIYIGQTKYAAPVHTFSEAANILKKKTAAFISKSIWTSCEKALSPYSSDAIDIVREYLEEAYDLHVVSLDDDTFQDEDPSSYAALLRGNYIELGQEYNIIDTAAEFDRIYEILCVLARYNLI